MTSPSLTVRIRAATVADLPAIVAVHRSAFPRSFLTLMGPPFLRRYYALLLGYVGGIVLVAERPGRVIGLAAGPLAPDLFRAIVRSAKISLGFSALCAVLRRPSLLRRLFANYRRTGADRGDRPPSAVQGLARAELASLAVRPDARQRGVGSALTRGFVSEARARGAGAVSLTTDEANNNAVRRFYERLGFERAHSFSPYPGRVLASYFKMLVEHPATEAPETPPRTLRLRRVFDLFAALVGLLAASPVILCCAAAIKVSDRGSVFYRHERVGRFGRRFRMWKLRTMILGADRLGGPLTTGADPRITPVGRLLRRYKLDELPQFLNVLAGEMSLIGPRPEAPRYVDPLDRRWRRTLQVRPGVTDLASLVYRNEQELLATVPDADSYYRAQLLPTKLALSLETIERRSWRFDLGLLAYTAALSLRPHPFGAAMDPSRFRPGRPPLRPTR